MDAIELVKTGLKATEAGQAGKFGDLLADDMVFAGPVPQPIGKREFVGLQTALVAAMPDWKFNASGFKQAGDQVIADMQITGTHTGELSLPMPGFPKLAATGKRVSLPNQPTTFTVKDGKITRIEAEPLPGTGVPGILAQLGVSMPGM